MIRLHAAHSIPLQGLANHILDLKSFSTNFESLFLFNHYNIPHLCFYCGKEIAGLYIEILLFLEAKVLRERKHFLFRQKGEQIYTKKGNTIFTLGISDL